MNPQKLTNEKLNKSLKPFENKNIFYSVKNKNRFLDKRLLIVGGGDSAFEWALGLKDYAKEVTHIHRSDRYKAELSTVAEVQHSKLINFKPFHELKNIKVGDGFEGATIFDNRNKQETTLDLDYILLLLGFDPKEKLGPIKDWGLDLIQEEINGELVDKYIRVNERQETYIPGVYAIGDIAKHPNVENMGLIATGFGQAPIAVGYAYVFIHPGASVKPGHSSNLKL